MLFLLTLVILGLYLAFYEKLIFLIQSANILSWLLFSILILIALLAYKEHDLSGESDAGYVLFLIGFPLALRTADLFLMRPKGIALLNEKEQYFKTKREKQALRDAYGAKGWATQEDIVKRIGYSTNGIYIGNDFHWNEKGHMLTVGGAGSGKGVNLIIPALLSPNFIQSGTSVVVLDPKGENAAVCAPYLNRCGYDVKILNPTNIREINKFRTTKWSPLLEIAPDDEKKMCDLIAYSIHNRTGGGDGSFFDNKARQYISLYFRFAMHCRIYELSEIYNVMMLTGEKRIEFLSNMVDSPKFSGKLEAENIINSFLGDSAKTEESIYATIREAMNIFGDEKVTNFLDAPENWDSEPDDTYLDLSKIPKKPTAVFLCIRHEELKYYAPFLRIFTNFLLKYLTRFYNPDRKVLVLLDEFAQLGYVEEFKNSPAVLRGYNVTLWPIVQELGQLKSIYGDHWETFISNAAVKHWLGGGMDNTTAKYIEERMPIDIKFVGNNADGSPREVQTKLMTAEQIMKMDHMIVEVAGIDKPIKMDKKPYYEHDIFKKNAAPNPFY